MASRISVASKDYNGLENLYSHRAQATKVYVALEAFMTLRI